MTKVLLVSGHPDLDSSNANTVIVEQLGKTIPDIEIRRLDKLSPHYVIDVEAEQAALLKADIIVLQFPFYWYSVPALMKKWIDDVLSYNFAYGAKGDKLKGKHLFLSFTVGGPEASYSPLGYNHFRIEELLKPLEQTVLLTGMNYHPPVYSNGMVYIPNVYNTLEDVQGKALEHAERLTLSIKSVSESIDVKLKSFATRWFHLFDKLEPEDEFFISHLSEDVHWEMPDGTFHGHAGFRDWYKIARETFKPNCQHIVEQIDNVKEKDGQFVGQLRIRLIAETHSGDSINMLVNEYWTFDLDDDAEIIISKYLVEVVNG